ncbi:MAG TPA: amidase [Acidimicrobiia bacterium]|nr:amidase [Acidimicrobiia bacterium]
MKFTRRQMLAAAAAAPFVAGKVASAAESGFRPLAAEPTSTNPADLTLVELLPLLESRQLSSLELVEACIDRIDRYDPQVKAFEQTTFDIGLAEAVAIDDARAKGRPVGPLAGIPIGLKDMTYTKEVPTTGSSKAMEGFIPDYDATVWVRLQEAGLVLLGKLSCHEFAYGTASPPTVNPWDTQRGPGGSSGGSGAALAARMLPAATGTDTAGSIILPSATCGTAGLKPTYGRCSRHGNFPLSWSLDNVGPMARRIADCALLLQVMAGSDPADPTSLQAPVPTYPMQATADLKGVRIGLLDKYFWDDIDPDVERVCREGVARLSAMGAEVVTVPAPPVTDEILHPGPNPYGAIQFQKDGQDAAVKIILSEAASFHRRISRERPHQYTPETLGLLAFGETVSAADYLDAQRLRSVWVRQWRDLFTNHRLDAVASPAVPTEPPYQTPSSGFIFGPSFRLTKAFNLNGLPTVSVPVGLDNRGYPVGLMLGARHLDEPRLLEIALALDEDVRFFTRKPPILEAGK